MLGVSVRGHFYIMDFFSHECMLAIELDEATHSSVEEIEHDEKRERFISGTSEQ